MRIKDVPEDFVVEEIAEHALDPEGEDLLLLLRKP